MKALGSDGALPRRRHLRTGRARFPGTRPSLPTSPPPWIRRTPRHWTDIDRHYQALRLEMMALFADIGIACG
jgi:hypothetical protein